MSPSFPARLCRDGSHFEKRDRPCCLWAAKESQRGAGYFCSTAILFKCRLIVAVNCWQQIDYQLTTGSDFYCRWSVFIVGTLFYIACDGCSVAVQNQQKIAVYHRIACRVVVFRQLRQGRFLTLFFRETTFFALAKARWSTVVRPRIDHYWKLTTLQDWNTL